MSDKELSDFSKSLLLDHARRIKNVIERDRPDADELAAKAEVIGMWLAERHGRYADAGVMVDIVSVLREQAEQIEELKARAAQFVHEVAELRDQLATYRVVETFPATRETPAEYGVRRVHNDEDYEGD